MTTDPKNATQPTPTNAPVPAKPGTGSPGSVEKQAESELDSDPQETNGPRG